MSTTTRSRWAALGAAVAVSLGAGGLLTTDASIGSGERAVYVPITPCRLIDTRPAPDTVGTRTSPLGPNETLAVTVRGANGRCTIPADAVGLVMNVAIISPTDASFLTVFPSDAPLPLAANANWLANDPPKSNAVTADVSADGRVSFYNLKGTVHIAVDIVGYYVDHTHDDRYYTKSQADVRYNPPRSVTLSAFDMVLTGGGNRYLVESNDCVRPDIDIEGRIPIEVPIGWRLGAVHVVVYDAPGNSSWDVVLEKHVTTSSGLQSVALAIATGATGSSTVTRDLVPSTPEVADVGESFLLSTVLGSASVNLLCQVSVDLVPPP